MEFSQNEFLSRVKTIDSNNYDYGNEVLYRNCGFGCLPAPGGPQIDTKLRSAIWLIGKSYSADPTRSARSMDHSNDGLGISFERIAERMYHSEVYNVFHEDLRALREKTYCYCYEDDKETLLKTVDLVHRLNEMVKGAMGDDSKNVVSFCSKFLHFMCPNLFFITDSYSYTGGIALYTGTADRKLFFSDADSSQHLRIDQSVRDYFTEHYRPFSPEDNKYREPILSYYRHCLRAYSFARFLHDHNMQCAQQINGDANSCYMPRLVDSVLIRIRNETA